MKQGPARRRQSYFCTPPGAPQPLVARVQRRIQFSDVDAMGVLWHGRYAQLFEQANEQIGRVCGMTYEAFFLAGLLAPIVQIHVDYFASVLLGEQVTTVGRMVWNDAARLDIEYEVYKEDGRLAATGYTVQMFVNKQGEPLLTPPLMHTDAQRRWAVGEFHQKAEA